MVVLGASFTNQIKVTARGQVRAASRPCLWLGHLLGAKPEPWLLFQVPGIILNAYQILRLSQARESSPQSVVSPFMDGPLMIDSGGYNLIKNPACPITTKDLVEVYRTVDADIVVSLDIPPHPGLSTSETQARWKKTKKNAFELSRILDDRKVMPVVHGYSEDSLRRNSREIRDLVEDSGMIGLGGLVPLFKLRLVRALQLVSFLRREYPDKLLHVFGAGSVSTMLILTQMGVDSMDTIGWRIKAAYGAIQLPGQSDRFVSPKLDSPKCRRGLSPQETALLGKCECPVCRGQSLKERLKRMDNSVSFTFNNRAIHNCWVFTQELMTAQRAKAKGTLQELLEERMSRGYWAHALRSLRESACIA